MARFDAFEAFSSHKDDFEHPFLNSSPDYTPRHSSLRTSRPIGDMTTNLSFRDRSKRLLDIENEKNQLIEDLLYHLELTEKLLDQTRLDHGREAHYNRENQLRETKLQDQLRMVKQIMDRDPYVILLIDGEGSMFSNDLIKKGAQGGREGAQLLSCAANEFVAQTLPHLNNPRVLVRIYANVRGTAEALCKTGVIDKPAVFDDFIRSFNSSKILFDFVDAGGRKDAVGDKLGELLKLYLYDCHCHQIILGCSSESDYAPFLEEIVHDQQVQDNVTLLESIPFEGELSSMKSKFRSTKFENLFRTTKLASSSTAPMPKPLQTIQATLPALSRVSSNNTSVSASSTPAVTWASMTAAPFIPAASRSVTPSTQSPLPSHPAVAKSVPGIDRNRLGQRIDKFDPAIPREEIQRIKKLKLCNIFYLQGPDACTNLNCSHDHDYQLNAREKKYLREVARMTPCYYQTECDDVDCIYGHRCPQSKPNEKECWYKENCRFDRWGHGIDERVVKTTRV